MGLRVQAAVVAIAFALAGEAGAKPAARVEIRALPDHGTPPELVDTLRIYLASSASVVVGAALAGTTLDARIAEASAGLAPGRLVTWLERAPGEDGAYTVVVVGERDGRAAVEVGRLDGPDTTAVSRLLALRIGAFLDETLTAGPSSPLAAPAPPRRRLRPIAEIGGGGAGDGDGWHGEAALALGARLARPGYRIEAVALGRFGWPRRTRDAAGEVSLGLIDVAAGARFVVPIGPTWLGIAGELGARRARADGMAPDGATGVAVRWLPIARVGIDARLELGAAIAIRGAVGVERGLEVQRFTLHGTPLAEVGRLAACGGISVVIPLDAP